MSEVNHSFGRDNAWYLARASDRADELIAELDPPQLRKLFDALKTRSLPEWLLWLEETRDEIKKYDWLKPAARKRRLQGATLDEALLLHHACIYVELWRARTHRSYFHFPPQGMPVNTAETQREMLLAILASHNAFEESDLWPFEMPEGEDQIPFRR